MSLQTSERKPNKFNEVFSSANRFLDTGRKAENPFVTRGDGAEKSAEVQVEPGEVPPKQ